MFVDLTSTDPFLKYIPHDGVLYVWMRLGAVGALAFWSMIGLACIRACRLLRSHDPGLAAYGAFVVCALMGTDSSKYPRGVPTVIYKIPANQNLPPKTPPR